MVTSLFIHQTTRRHIPEDGNLIHAVQVRCNMKYVPNVIRLVKPTNALVLKLYFVCVCVCVCEQYSLDISVFIGCII